MVEWASRPILTLSDLGSVTQAYFHLNHLIHEMK